MPANDSIQHRGVSAVRNGRRFAPYQSTSAGQPAGLKAHASCPAIISSHYSHSTAPTLVSSPTESSLDTNDSEISSTATLVNPSFGTECGDSPVTPAVNVLDKTLKPWEKVLKYQLRQSLHQKKADYVSVLIDYACKTLNEIWPCQSIPAVFRYQCGATFGYSEETRDIALEDFSTPECDTDLISLRKFVQELLRRSRSTCSTLQTALCYLEAVRLKVPELQAAEQEGHGIRGDHVNCEGRIVVDESARSTYEISSPQQFDSCKTSKLRKPPSQPDTPLPLLPSALLCPRRAFMGALVLSAKFVQDKCYSNRAWAKLCGLPAREVSRCERALGDALGWRLWVGKDSLSPFAGLESKVGRAPTMLHLGPAVDDRKDSYIADKVAVSPLARSQTWPSADAFEAAAATFISQDSEYSISPTPSLSFSVSSSSSSSCSSGGLSPILPSPSPSFVSNDPCSITTSTTKCGIAGFRFADHQSFIESGVYDAVSAMRGACGDLFVSRREQDVFGMRVGDVIEVL